MLWVELELALVLVLGEAVSACGGLALWEVLLGEVLLAVCWEG